MHGQAQARMAGLTLDRTAAGEGGRARLLRRLPSLGAPPDRDRRLAVLGLTITLAVPMIVALAALHEPRWLPLVDMAQIEMRVRDVPTSHPPLLGLGGRIRGFDEAGAHPGPMAFYLLWPVYALLGSSAWALQVSSAVLSLAAVGLAIGIAHRRGGLPLAAGTAAMLAVLLHAYGAVMVTEPWNPRLPVLWWPVLLLAVWSVLCRDLVLLPVAIAVGTYCMQTHIPYVALVGGLWVLMFGSVVRQVRASGPSRVRRPLALGAGLLALLWAPPLFEQFTRVPGNLSIIIENFSHPYDDGHPFGDAFDLWIRTLDVPHLVRGDIGLLGSPLRGGVFLALWAASAALAVRRRDRARDLVALHLVVGVALLLGLFAISRIFGPFWPYLMYWAWGTTALALLALVWTLAAATAPAPGNATDEAEGEADNAAGTRERPRLDVRAPRPVVLGAIAVLVVATTAFTLDAPDTEMEGTEISADLALQVPEVVDFLRADPAGCGDDCMYLVTWTDPVSIGSSGYGLLLELERQGFDARAETYEAPAVRLHRTATRRQIDGEIHVVRGDPAVEIVMERSNTQLIAMVDPHTPGEREEFLELRRELLAQLRADGEPELARKVALQSEILPDPRMSEEAVVMAYYANRFQHRSAVFYIDPEAPRDDLDPPTTIDGLQRAGAQGLDGPLGARTGTP